MKFKNIISLVLMILILSTGTVNAYALNTGFSTDSMTLESQKNFLSNIQLLLITEEPEKNSIQCFDVNYNEMIAIGSENSTKKTISVYNSSGNFQYGYQFTCEGSFAVEWDSDNLIIYFVRSDIAALFDPNGNNLEMKAIQDTVENNNYWNHSVNSIQRTVNGNQYCLKNNMGIFNVFASSYSQLIKTDINGNTMIFYDFSREYTVKFIIEFISLTLFIILVITVVILQFIKQKKGIKS